MLASIRLCGNQRKVLLRYYRQPTDPALRLRAHIILLRADGHAWAVSAALLYCSTRTIARWQERFLAFGVAGLAGEPRGPQPWCRGWWQETVARWVTRSAPRAFGFVRSRWCCAVLVVLLWERCAVRVGRETVRLGLHRAQLVWRRPRPVVSRRDPERRATLQRLRQLLRALPPDETAVFEDEVDINTNPKIGSMWMRRGRQAAVVTPGDNAKRYLAGALPWRTGALLVTEGTRRNGALFVRHLEDLRCRLRR